MMRVPGKWRRIAAALWLLFTVAAVGSARADATREPLWAYGYTEPPSALDKAPSQTIPPMSRRLRPGEPEEEQTRLYHVTGSGAAFSKLDVWDGSHVADWFPSDHPSMSTIVLHGPAKLGATSWGCGFCHLPNGKGRPENAPVAAQSVTYFLRQLEDFRSDLRTSADPRKPNTPLMAGLAKVMTEGEMKEAAAYFASIQWTARTRVVETNLVPATQIKGNLFIATDKAMTQPIAGRIIEVPENEEQSEVLRNPRSGFVAYVPSGSIHRGASLVKTGSAGTTLPCGSCHGADLMGQLDVPGIAGRSASYLVRQLYDFQRGTRKGASSAAMLPVVAKLSADDMVSIAAYLTSRVPPSSASRAFAP